MGIFSVLRPRSNPMSFCGFSYLFHDVFFYFILFFNIVLGSVILFSIRVEELWFIYLFELWAKWNFIVDCIGM